MAKQTIVNADCVSWMRDQPDHSIDVVLTSPPYDDIRKYKGYKFDFENTAKQLHRIVKENGVIIWNVADATHNGSETGTSITQALYFKEIGFKIHDTMIYVKRNPMPTNVRTKRYHQAWEYLFVLCKGTPKTFNPIMRTTKYEGIANMKYRGKDGTLKYKKTARNATTKLNNVFEYTIGGGHTSKNKLVYGHPALMPEQLALDMLATWAEKGDVILDPFAGAGTTLWAAKQLAIDCVGTEIDKNYCRLIQQRLK
jgi:DNA modification methylase